jgi:hypothetical protein
MRKKDEARTQKKNQAKRAYESPRLIEFGSVAKLTASTGTQPPSDGPSGGMMMGV